MALVSGHSGAGNRLGAGGRAGAGGPLYVRPHGRLVHLLAWLAADMVQRWPGAKLAVITLMAIACACSAVAARGQLQYWSNTESLFQHALEVNEENYIAHHNLGNLFADVPGRMPEAVAHLRAALRLRAGFS